MLFLSIICSSFPSGHSIGYSNFKGRPNTFLDGSKAFAERISSSPLFTSSTILPILQLPLGSSSLIKTMSHFVAEFGDLTRVSFRLICDLPQA